MPRRRRSRQYYQQLALQEAAAAGIPGALFLSLIDAESGWNPNAGSSAGAIGLGQLMPGTAAGLHVNPYNPQQNLRGAATYLASMLRRFGSPELALSAYNSGPGGSESSGRIENIAETRNYVAKVMRLQSTYAKFDTGGNVGNAPMGHKPRRQGKGTPITSFLDAPPDVASITGVGPLTQRAVAGVVHDYELSRMSDSGQVTPKQMKNNPVVKAMKGNVPMFNNYGAPLGGKWRNGGGTAAHGSRAIGNWESDNAVDLLTPRGTPVYAMFNGTIGSQFGALNSRDPKMAGLRLHLLGKNNELYYAHLSRFAPGLHPGQRVKKGQLIGFSGTANGVDHLHLGYRNGNPDYLLNWWS